MDGGRKARGREERHSIEDLRPRRKTFREYSEALKAETAPAERHRTVKTDSGPIGRQEDNSEPNYDGCRPQTITFNLLQAPSGGGQSRPETTRGSRTWFVGTLEIAGRHLHYC